MFFVSIIIFLVYAFIGLALFISSKRKKYIEWYESGSKKSECYVVLGELQGRTIFWYENGQKWFEGFYRDSKQSGLWTFWDEQGHKTKEIWYENGVKVKSQEY